MRIRPDRPQVTLSGLEDFRRVVRTELLRAQMVQADIQDLRRRVQDMQHRLTLIDGQKDDARRSIDRLKRDVELLSESGERSTREEQASAEDDVQRDTDSTTTQSRTETPPPGSTPKPPRVTCQVVDVTNPRETKPGAYRWTFHLLFTETNDVPCNVELVRRTRWPRPLQAERDDAKWRHIDFFLTGFGSGPHTRKIGPESLTLPAELKFKGSYEAVFRVIYDERRKELPQPIVVKWYPRKLPTLPDTQPTRTVVLSGGLSPRHLKSYNKVDTDPDPEAVNYRSTIRSTRATVTLRGDGTAEFSGVKVVYYSREVKQDNGREITVTIRPGRGKISGDAAIGKTTGTYVEHVWIRKPYRGQKQVDKILPPVTKRVGWGAYKQRDGTYVLSIRCPKRLINTDTLKFVLTSGGSRQ